MTARENVVNTFMNNIGIGLRGIKNLRKSRSAGNTPRTLNPLQQPRPPTTPRPMYNTMGASLTMNPIRPSPRPSAPAPFRDEASLMFEAQQKAERERLKKNVKDVKVKNLQTYLAINRLTVEELKKKIKNEYNVEEWTMGGIKKRDLVLKYLNLAGIKVQGLKKPK